MRQFPPVLLFAALLSAQTQTRVTAFEGARLITGNGDVIENSAFLVEEARFTQVGRRGELRIPAGAAQVDLTGKTVMPTKVDLHGHIGFQHDVDGTMAKEYYTRENLMDHLQRLAYYGFSAIIGIGDLTDRSDLHGGRTHWGDVPLRVRDEIVPGAALFRTAGPGIAWPDSGAQGHPSRADVPYPVTTVAEAIEAVRDNARMKPEFIKIWVDDRGGTKKKLTPELYLPIIEEAHRLNIPVGAHNVTLADAKLLMRAGVEGWLHLPVRMGEVPDDELIGIIKDRIARKDRPNMWFNPGAGWTATSREDWNDPLLRETVPASQIQAQWGDYLAKLTPESVAGARENLKQMGAANALRLRDAGMKIVLGSDTGQTRFFIGWMGQLEMENWVWMGLTPMQAIVAATRDSAEMGHFNTGVIAAGKNADFIVLNANPLDNIANSRRIDKVYLRGEEVDRAAMKAKWQSRW
ncbi:MAG: amidohydrolase family protein [Bryobacterales bacterium]|nr:amidohydrolase family protein [Bryobacterales bacterium]MBV9400884.1 amidohydrolase family protein [Bryobacterales bacterium]